MNDNDPLQDQVIDFESIIVPERHPMIYQEMPDFDFRNPQMDPTELAIGLAHVMLKHGALGLAANQIGLPFRCFVIAANPIIACFNPRIVDSSPDMVELDEGCLSFRNMILKVKRPQVIKVRYTQPNGEIITRQFQNITAQVFQHELDHLNGIPFTKHVSSLKLEAARQEKKKLDRMQMVRDSVTPKLKV